MGRTNVRGGHDFLQRAGYGMDYGCGVPEFGDLPLIIVSLDFMQDDLDRFADVIRFGRSDTWVTFLSSGPGALSGPLKKPTFIEAPANQRLSIPKVHVSKGLKKYERLRSNALLRDMPVEKHQPVELAYILVVQDRSGALRSKLILRTNLDAVGSEIFYEAVNGFSVVFSGAILKKNLERRTDQEFCFKKADSLDELQAMDEDTSKKVIGVLC